MDRYIDSEPAFRLPRISYPRSRPVAGSQAEWNVKCHRLSRTGSRRPGQWQVLRGNRIIGSPDEWFHELPG